MKFTHRYRKSISLVVLTALMVASTATPAVAEYNPRLGRFMQGDPNGMGLVLSPGLLYNGSNPTVTVSMAYELQYGDGMNFYEYLKSNVINGTDPSGLFGLTDLMTTQSMSSFLRTTGTLAGIGIGGAGVFGGIRSGYQAQLNGRTSREIATAAVLGAGYTGIQAIARVLIASAIIATGPGGLALAGGIGVFESSEAYGGARERQELAQTQEELSLATFDSVFATLGIGGSLFGSSVGLRSAALASRAIVVPSRAYSVLRQVRNKNGAPPPGYKGGGKYRNEPPSSQLPRNGKFKEYDIDPLPARGSGMRRNAERFIIDENTGNAWYTSDHYLTFKPM